MLFLAVKPAITPHSLLLVPLLVQGFTLDLVVLVAYLAVILVMNAAAHLFALTVTRDTLLLQTEPASAIQTA